MNNNKQQPDRTIGVLVFLFVLVFAGVVFFRFSPWGPLEIAQNNGETNIETSASAPAEETLPSGPDDGEEDPALFNDSDMPVLNMQLEAGTVRILLRPDLAPNHVSRLIQLSESGFYDGIVFHRVIDGFMAQTGDPTGTGMGGSELPDLEAEFNDRSFVRGTLGMARSASPDSANSQFFIVYDDASNLNGQYTLFGRVIEGMEFVDGLRKGSQANNGQVTDPDHIVSMRLAADQ